jgi:hypothetical protein
MSWEALTAVGTLGSALVVAVAAGAAVLQMRHLRNANQLEAILRIYDSFNGNEMLMARRYCLNDLPAALTHDASRAAILRGDVDPRVTFVGNFFNETGALVVDGFLDERLIWPLVPTAARLWHVPSGLAYEWRRPRPDPVWADFEYLAALEERVTQSTHIGRFPGWFRARLLQARAEHDALSADAPAGPQSELG